MIKKELAEELARRKVKPFRYNLDGQYTDQAHVLLKDQDQWIILYCEAGRKTIVNMYATEGDACDAMLELLAPKPKWLKALRNWLNL